MRAQRYRIGLFLALAGNLLVIVAFFAPWFDVFKLNDPSFPFPNRGYSPWMVLESGQVGALGVVAGLFLLLILGIALSTLMVALTHSARRHTHATSIARALAVVCLTVMIVGVPIIPFALSFSWPFLSSTPTYGLFLAVAGFASVLLGLARISAVGASQQ